MPSLQRSLPIIKRLASADAQHLAAASWLARLNLHTPACPESSSAYSSTSGSSKDSGHEIGQQHDSTGIRHATALPMHLQFPSQSPSALFCTGSHGLHAMPERQCSLSAAEQLAQLRPYATRVGRHQEQQRRRGAMSVRGAVLLFFLLLDWFGFAAFYYWTGKTSGLHTLQYSAPLSEDKRV